MIEEAYEAIDAIEYNDMDALREELGDVLLQVVLHSQMASEAGAFSIEDVVADVRDKMIRRHPHVFGAEAALIASHLTPEQQAQIEATMTAGQVLDLWDQIKLVEKQQKAERKAARAGGGASPALRTSGVEREASVSKDSRAEPGNDKEQALKMTTEGLLDGVPQALPALMQAQDISRKAVSVGFEWPDVASVWEQVASEIEEYRAEEEGSPHAAAEFGDVLFSLVNVARKEGIDAESALRATCRKFRARWAIMEQSAQMAGKQLFEYSTEELEELWQVAKAASQDSKEVRQ
jgi:tetrapyrrole methylase family protein/MazG family protein